MKRDSEPLAAVNCIENERSKMFREGTPDTIEMVELNDDSKSPTVARYTP